MWKKWLKSIFLKSYLSSIAPTNISQTSQQFPPSKRWHWLPSAGQMGNELPDVGIWVGYKLEIKKISFRAKKCKQVWLHIILHTCRSWAELQLDSVDRNQAVGLLVGAAVFRPSYSGCHKTQRVACTRETHIEMELLFYYSCSDHSTITFATHTNLDKTHQTLKLFRQHVFGSNTLRNIHFDWDSLHEIHLQNCDAVTN